MYKRQSYTKYENRIGLASNGKFLEDSQDVVLDFPFKDGVLTASMTKEDNEDSYDDAFLNEVIEKDEIDRLFDKKVFVNVKRFGDNQTAQHSLSLIHISAKLCPLIASLDCFNRVNNSCLRFKVID